MARPGAARPGGVPWPVVAGSPAARRLGACLFLAVIAAVVTGPSGDADRPLAGIEGSFTPARAAGFAAGGLALWALSIGADRLTTRLRSAGHGAALGGGRPAALGGGAWVTPAGAAWASFRRGRWAAFRRGRWSAPAGNLALLAVAVAVPPLLSTAAQQALVSEIGIYALLALGLNVVVGYAGLLDLGYIAFFAIGAYTTAYVTSADAMPWHAPWQVNPFFALPVALVVAAVAGVVLGGPTLRLRGDYLAIVTLGFGEIVQLLANNADGVTGGPRGVFGLPPLSVDLPGVHYSWGLRPLPYYYLLVVLIVLVMVVFGRWERSRTGRAWTAIRQDEVAAEATGVATMRMKLLAFAVGASVSGFAGVVLATKQFFNPQTFGLQSSLLVLTIVIFGGMGSRLGVVLGALVLQGTAFLLRDTVPPADRYIYFGAVVILMMIFRPQGLLPPRGPRAPASPGPAAAPERPAVPTERAGAPGPAGPAASTEAAR
ncbi:branched-chain amino acid ABC transporter permease [Parafrankia sp. FMc6]|uniref:branched-chain amino acid ABC transporter permease n=1 Tax=Parafrankia soli TaxID=2599596 RepID=UPI0034D4E839